MANPSTQQPLCRDLRLLETMSYNAISHPRSSDAVLISNKESRTKAENDEIHLLDIIANCLCTGEQGDVVATTFIKNGGYTLVIAKNSPPTASDKRTAEEILTAASTADERVFLSTVMKHSGKNILKRIKKLSDCFNANNRDFKDLETNLGKHTPTSLKDEFPDVLHVEKIVKALKLSADESPAKQAKQALLTALEQIKRVAQQLGSLTNFESLPGDKAVNTLRYLDARCNIFANSAFMKTIPSSDYIERLIRRFNKVLQNIGGVERVRTRIKKSAMNPKLLWVNELPGYVQPTGPAEVQMADTFAQALEAAGIARSDVEAITGLAGMESKWKKGKVTPRFHCELNLVKSLAHLYPAKPGQKAPTHVIGCSKRSCLSCVLWINAFNVHSKTNFMTSGSHGKPYAAWALPGLADVDDIVCNDIHRRVETTVDAKIPKNHRRQQSDEFFSGGSDWENRVHEDNLDVAEI